jgi:hypothetical protein
METTQTARSNFFTAILRAISSSNFGLRAPDAGLKLAEA